MNQIKFSKRGYCKLPSAKIAVLSYVTMIQLEKQTKAFLDYDTTYFNDNGSIHVENGSFEKYPLPPRGEYLLLLFIADGAIFTTLRRRTHEKEQYYVSKIGEEFEIIIEDKEVSK